MHPESDFSTAFTSFLIIGFGGLACVLGGYISEKKGIKKTAGMALFLSGICCLISPLVFYSNSEEIFIGFMVFWGLVVVADSPLFSTLVAKNASPESRGTALTIVNCIGYSITIFSIQLLNSLIGFIPSTVIFLFLALGPMLGLLLLFTKRKTTT